MPTTSRLLASMVLLASFSLGSNLFAQVTTQTTTPPAPTAAQPDSSAKDAQGSGEVMMDAIDEVKTEELTAELAKKTVDSYQFAHDKYKDNPWEKYETMQGFADTDPKGKPFEADMKTFGFANLDEWQLAVTTVSQVYNNLISDQTEDYKAQIEDIRKATDMSQDMKDRNIRNLQSNIPSENNVKVVTELMKDVAYGEKIKLLEATAE